MKISHIYINDYYDSSCLSGYYVTLDTTEGMFHGTIYTVYNDISPIELGNDIIKICGNFEIEDDLYQLVKTFKEEIILRR